MRLSKWLNENCINVSSFAKKVHVTQATIYRIAEGYDMRLSTALKIQRATKSEVTVEDLLTEKARKEVEQLSDDLTVVR